VFGDLNIILPTDEAWDEHNESEITEDYFRDIFTTNNLIDIRPTKVVPTWRNGCLGLNAVARRLDRFMVAEELINKTRHNRSWIDLPYSSDHAPVFLQLDLPPAHKFYPFKFNGQ